MATSLPLSSPFFPSLTPTTAALPYQNSVLFPQRKRAAAFKILAAKVPAGVEFPKQEPKFQAPFAGFTRTAETWNSRACMIGLIGTFIVELILHKGILQMIGVEVGKGLDIPL